MIRASVRRLRWPVAVLAGLYLLTAAGIVAYGLDDEIARADVIVVPGNTIAPDGSPSPRLRARLDAALGLYREGAAPVILVSGGVGVEGFDEAASMAAYLHAHRVPAAAIVLDPAGVDTTATALHTAAYLRAHGGRTALVATQYFHVARTQLLLGREGVDVVGTVHARYVEFRDVWSVAREVPALAVVAVRGWVAP